MDTITASDLAELSTGDRAVIVDVREDSERAAVRIDGSTHIPMSEFMAREGELPDHEPVYVICHLGGRSANVVRYLEQKGVAAVNVDGGMDAWEHAGLPVSRGA